MRVTRPEIARLIPHAGAMCLLDGVEHWDDRHIRCVSKTHTSADNPLRVDGHVPAVCGVEYAAQAMAVHGGLVGKTAGRPSTGYLASLRNVVCRSDRLDDLAGELVVEVELLAGDDERVIYRFALRVGNHEVLSGQAAVVLSTDRRPA